MPSLDLPRPVRSTASHSGIIWAAVCASPASHRSRRYQTSSDAGGKVQEYRVHRATTPPVGKLLTYKGPARAGATSEATPAQVINPAKYKAPARSTLHDEIVTLRQVLKTAVRHGWLAYLPDLSPPYRTQGKVVHRPWFSPAEYKQLYEAMRAYAREPFHEHYRWNAEQVHDYVLFMANTGLRPDEARHLQHRDVVIAEDEATGEKILEIEVRGKRGVGFCKSMPSAVQPYERRSDAPSRRKPRAGGKGSAVAATVAPGLCPCLRSRSSRG